MAEIFGKPFFVRSQTTRENGKGKVDKKKGSISVFHFARATHPLKTNQKKVTVRIEFSSCPFVHFSFFHFSFFGSWRERISDARIYSAYLSSVKWWLLPRSFLCSTHFSRVYIAVCIHIKREKDKIRMICPRRFFPDFFNFLFSNC